MDIFSILGGLIQDLTNVFWRAIIVI